MIVRSGSSTLSSRRYVADRVKKDMDPTDEVEEDTLTWAVKEAAGLLESLFADDPITKDIFAISSMPNSATKNEDENKDDSLQDCTAAPQKQDDTFPRSVYDDLELAEVLQETRIFHDDVAVKSQPIECLYVLTKLLRLMEYTHLTEAQATDVFFASTKLFVCQDEFLRRFVYLFLKEIHTLCDPNDVIIITSSLMKDLTCELKTYRANSLRVLACIINVGMLGAIERFIKQAIIDDYAPLSSAGLLAGITLTEKSSESAAIVRKWISEATQAVSKHKGIVQYHAILLLYQMKRTDRLAVTKIVSQYSKRGALSNPMALVMIIRYTAVLLQQECRDFPGVKLPKVSPTCQEGFEFLNTCLKLKSEMVVYEAARALSLLTTNSDELQPIVSTLQGFLLSPKPSVRMASLKTIAVVADDSPGLVVKCNETLEAIANNKEENPSMVTLALITLLKTCTEHMLDGLLDNVSGLIATIDTDDRIRIVQSVLLLCVTYPRKHPMIIDFLSGFLMRRASHGFKRAIVKGIVESMEIIPETVEDSLFVLSKSLDACEHLNLATEILCIIAEKSKYIQEPSRHIPYVYNCFLLGNAPIRAATVSALASFASHHRSLRESLLLLLKKCRLDDDEETRDRSSNAIRVLTQANFENKDDDDNNAKNEARHVLANDLAAHIFSPLDISFHCLEKSLEAMKADTVAMKSDEELCFDLLPEVKDDPPREMDHSLLVGVRAKRVDPADDVYSIPDLASLGRVLKSAVPVALSEREAEYVVHCIKHIYEDLVVLQFKVQNTVEQQRMENVSVAIFARDDEEQYEATGELPAASIGYGETGSCFLVLKCLEGASVSPSTFACELQFRACALDEDRDECGKPYEEEYALEDIEISQSDYMSSLIPTNFRSSWETCGTENEVFKKVGLQMSSLEECVQAVIDFLGMSTCDNTGRIKEGATKHMLHLSGSYLDRTMVLARAQIIQHGDICVLKISIRSQELEVATSVLGWIC